MAWQFAEMETSVGEVERARAIYELAINQAVLDMPEVLWKSYIDFEIAQGEFDNTRTLYERLLDRTKHVKVRREARQWPAVISSGVGVGVGGVGVVGVVGGWRSAAAAVVSRASFATRATCWTTASARATTPSTCS
jgi:hypothetical protein